MSTAALLEDKFTQMNTQTHAHAQAQTQHTQTICTHKIIFKFFVSNDKQETI